MTRPWITTMTATIIKTQKKLPHLLALGHKRDAALRSGTTCIICFFQHCIGVTQRTVGLALFFLVSISSLILFLLVLISLRLASF